MAQLLTRSLRHTAWTQLSAGVLGAHNHQPVYGSTNTKSYTARASKKYYDTLEVTPHASPAAVKAAYYRLSKKFHPDVNKTQGAADRFTEINEAYEVLGNAGSRRQYDDGTLNPLDIGTGHHGKVEVEYQEFIKKQGGFKVKKQPPRGRSHIYNFDEFYRMHYDEVRTMQSTPAGFGKRRFEELDERMESTENEVKIKARVILALGVFLVANAAGTIAYRLYDGTLLWL